MDAMRVEDPTHVGRYQLLGRLGTGGMGQVWLGRGPDGELAAVKVALEPYASDPRFRALFAREVTTARRVRAPWSAAVLAADPDADRPWLATEYVAGPSLREAVAAGGGLAEPDLLTLAARLAEALAQLHAMGVVHRDLKPANVLLAADGPRLIDFGIAHALDDTRAGAAMGTPAFMSPEQVSDDRAGCPSDVFSLASVLAFAASGQGPFGTTVTPVAMLSRIVHQPPNLTAVPRPLRDELERCLAKDPAHRPTAAELAVRFGALASGGGPWVTPAVRRLVDRAHRTPLGPCRQAWTPELTPRRERIPLLAVGLTVLTLLGGVAVAMSSPDDPAPHPTQVQEVTRDSL
ncbi:serine/threonine-protein kinase [Pseudonocardia spinosispora]|uniref:serine/threonine-protein kinase n=1 Tax=Pseudonocardia spinosispora TaxID=103441 RepID=UPI00041B904A|nr:serine/threonine-protein kinase [Pseudonocardia spinosispora]